MSEVELRCCHGAVVVRPGDKLVIAVPESDYGPGQFQQYVDEIATHLPGVVVIFVEANSLAVYRNEEQKNE